MRAMILGLAALLGATAVASAADISVVYLVDRSALMSAKAADMLTVDLYGDAECGVSLYATTLAVADLTLVERVSTLHLRGMPHHPRAARLVLTVPGVPPAPAYWARVEGRHVRPLGSPCQPQVAPVQTSLPCLRQDGTNVVVEGCNVHVRNGTGPTGEPNGLGNLVVGYDDVGIEGSHNVLVGGHSDVDGFGNLLVGPGHRVTGAFDVATGASHEVTGDGNVALGSEQSKALGYGAAVIASYQSSAFGWSSAVIGGTGNSLEGDLSAIVGGLVNKAGEGSAVMGGYGCAAEQGGIIVGGTGAIASGQFPFSDIAGPVIVGGTDNIALSEGSSVFGGRQNTAVQGSMVLGGTANTAGDTDFTEPATERFNVVVGGLSNVAAGFAAVVAGGTYNQSTGSGSIASGGSQNVASGHEAAVCGGSNNAALGEASTIGGGRDRMVSGPYDWRAGGLFEDQ